MNWIEIKKHNKKSDCWIVIDNFVIDITKYIDKHTGGDVILEYGGKDATDIFDKICHSNKAYELMLKFKIGELKNDF